MSNLCNRSKPMQFGLVILVLLVGLALAPPRGWSQAPTPNKKPKDGEKSILRPPRITPLHIPENALKGVNPKLLPKGTTGFFPAYDGDGFFFFQPPMKAAVLPSKTVFENSVVPILHSMSSELTIRDLSERFRIPAHKGVPMPKANLAKVAASACKEFESGGIKRSGAELDNARQVSLTEKFQRVRQVCEALAGKAVQPGSRIDKIIRDHEGMTFRQYVDDIQRQELEYFFRQIDPGSRVPIEHTGIRAARWLGQGITSVSGRVIFRYEITNRRILTDRQAAKWAPLALSKVDGVCCPERKAAKRVELLLLPYGEKNGKAALRFVYRIAVIAHYDSTKGTFYVWLDAEDGRILELLPLIDNANPTEATGLTFRRAPDRLPNTEVSRFDIDTPGGGTQFVLKLSGVFEQVDDYFNAEVTASSANFNHGPWNIIIDDPVNDPSGAINLSCATGQNKNFQQIDLMATLSRHRKLSNGAGLWTSFPKDDFGVWLNDPTAGCNASRGYRLYFGLCSGYATSSGALLTPNPNCPNAPDEDLNPVHDHTVIAHELGHYFTSYQYKYPDLASGEVRGADDRFYNWCLGATIPEGRPTPSGTELDPCPKPTGQGMLHDFADAWAHALESTNCFGGWWSKNQGGLDASLNCENHHPSALVGHVPHDEWGLTPRLSEVAVPFNAANPGDHFPEHRHLPCPGGRNCASEADYADGQIAAAALWSVRQGMRSKCLPSGTPQYFTRFVHALGTTGWLGTLSNSDRDIYRALAELEVKLAYYWVTSGQPGGLPGFRHNGAHTTNKVTAGFARTGIFMIPWACIDGDANSPDSNHCETGADAVIDIDDRDQDPTDDVDIDGKIHPEWDYIKQAGPSPIFHVWTGPLYLFSGGTATFPATPPCNAKFRVEASEVAFEDPAFNSATDILADSGLQNATQCYVAWPIPPATWTALVARLVAANKDRFYYRVKTQDDVGGNIRDSSSPGNGLFTVPSPYAIVNATGKP